MNGRQTETIITAAKGIGGWRLREIWDHRELLGFFVWRDIKVRYKQTVLGAAWAILQPAVAMVLFTVLFSSLGGSSDGVAYPLFSYSGLVVWTFLSHGVSQSAASLVDAARLLTKVYFPRIVIPVAAVLGGLVDLAVALPLLGVLMLWHGVSPGLGALWAVPFVLMAVAAATGVGLWLAAINVEYRDVRHAVPFLIQVWLFVSPVIYPGSLVQAKLESLGVVGWLYGLNPAAGALEGFRWALLGCPLDYRLVLVSAGASALLLVSSMWYFRRVERTFADVV